MLPLSPPRQQTQGLVAMKRPAANDVLKRPAAMKAKKAKTATKDNRDAANDVVGVSDASEGEAEVGAISEEDKGDQGGRDRLEALAVQRKICTFPQHVQDEWLRLMVLPGGSGKRNLQTKFVNTILVKKGSSWEYNPDAAVVQDDSSYVWVSWTLLSHVLGSPISSNLR